MEYESGKQALTAFEGLRLAGGRIAAIIMDINMPEMDGLETVWRIRAFEEQQRQACSCQDAVVPPSALVDDRDPESSAPRLNLPKRRSLSEQAGMDGCCERCRATPVWAVSACSLQEQSKSPAMQLMLPSHGGPPWKLAGFDAFVPKPLQPIQLANLLRSGQAERSTPFSEDIRQENLHLQASSSGSASVYTSLPTCSLDACTKPKRERAGQDLSQAISQTDSDPVTRICTQAS